MAGPCTRQEHADNVALLNGANGRVDAKFLQALAGHQSLIDALLEGCRVKGIVLLDLTNKAIEIFVKQILLTLGDQKLNDQQRAAAILLAVEAEIKREQEQVKKLFSANAAVAGSNANFNAKAARCEWLTVDKATYVIEDLNRLYPHISVHFPRGTTLDKFAKQAAIESLKDPTKTSAYVLVASSNAHWVVYHYDLDSSGGVREQFFNPRGDGFCGDRALAFIEQNARERMPINPVGGPTLFGPDHLNTTELREQTDRHVVDYTASVPADGKKVRINNWYADVNKIIAAEMAVNNTHGARASVPAVPVPASVSAVSSVATTTSSSSKPLPAAVASTTSATSSSTGVVSPTVTPVVTPVPIVRSVSLPSSPAASVSATAKVSLPVALVVSNKAERLANEKANEYLDELFAKQVAGELTEKQLDEKVKELFAKTENVLAKAKGDLAKAQTSVDEMFKSFYQRRPTPGYPIHTGSCRADAENDIPSFGSPTPRLIK